MNNEERDQRSGSSSAADATPAPQLDAASRTTGATVMGGAAWYSASVIAPQFFALVMSIAAARYLGPSLFGRQSFIAFVELAVALLLTESLYTAFMRNVGEALGKNRGPAIRALLPWVWGIEVVAAVVGGSVLFVAALAGAAPHDAWVLAGVACSMGILQAAPAALLIGAQNWRAASIAGLATGSLATVATVAVLAAGGGITGMFAVEAGVSTLSLVVLSVLALRMLRRIAPGKAPFSDIARRVARYAIPATGQTVLTLIVWRRSEFFFLIHYSASTQLALYSVSFAAITALTRLPAALASTLAPAFATLYGAGADERIRSGFSRALRLCVMVTIPLAAAALVFGPKAIGLVYGKGFSDATPVFLILLAAVPFIPISGSSAALITGHGRVRFLIIGDALAAVFDIGLAFALVPRLDAAGAAVANTVAQLVYALVVFYFALRLIDGVDLRLRSLTRIALASVGAALAGGATSLSLQGWLGLLAGVFVGVTAFALLAMQLRVLPNDDASWLDGHLGHRLRGIPGWLLRRLASGEIEATAR